MSGGKKGRGPYGPTQYDSDRHCGHKVERDPVVIQAKIDKLNIALETAFDGPRGRMKNHKGSLLHRLTVFKKMLVTAQIPELRDRPCVHPKGRLTNHPGKGFCWRHCECHGAPKGHGFVKHGAYSQTQNQTLLKLMDRLEEAETDLLDLTPDVKMLRAQLIRYVEENSGSITDLNVKSLTMLAEALRKMVETINEIKLRTAITREVFDVIMYKMGDVVQRYVKDPEVLDQIVAAWQKVTADPVSSRQKALAE